MSEDVIRTGRDLAYQGTVLKVYKDHMKFSKVNSTVRLCGGIYSYMSGV